MVRFHLLLILPSTKWHPCFKEPTLCSTSPAAIVSPSEGRPTFKAMRFSMVDEKILSAQRHVASSNNGGEGYCFLFLYKESAFARSIQQANGGSKTMLLLTTMWSFWSLLHLCAGTSCKGKE